MNCIYIKIIICVTLSFFPIFISSCGNVKNGELDFFDMPKTDSIIIVDISKNNFNEDSSFVFSDVFASVSYVPLESSFESTIGNVDKLEVTNQNDYIVFDRHNGIIVRFDSIGKYLNHIGYRGNGSNEYVFPRDVVYDRYNNQVIIYDLAKRSLLYYTLTGELSNKVVVDEFFDVFSVLDSTHLVTYSNNLKYSNDRINYNFRIINHNGKILSQYDSYTYERHDFRPCSDYVLKCQMGNTICNKMYTPIVFSIGISGICPLYYIDLGYKQIPKDRLLMGSDVDFSKQLYSSKYAYIKNVFESTDYYILNVVEQRIQLLYFISKKSDKQMICGKKGINDIGGLVSNTNVKNVQNEYVFFVIDPQYFCSKYEYCKNKSIPVGLMDSVLVSNMSVLTNPIIQRCSLRIK